jgi:hypothetical protein
MQLQTALQFYRPNMLRLESLVSSHQFTDKISRGFNYEATSIRLTIIARA